MLSPLKPSKSTHRSRRTFAATFAVAALCLWTAGCGGTSPIREYTVEAEQPQLRTSDLLRREFAPLPFDWATPQEWELTANDQFSKVAWQIGDALDGARVTVSDVSMGMGLVAQLNRWRGQVGIESDEKDNPMRDTEQLKVDGRTATYVTFHGPKGSILGMMMPIDNVLWVFKLRGATAVAKDQETAFRSFCESVNVPTGEVD